MMTVKITSEQELYELAAQLLHVVTNLRHWEKLLIEHVGTEYRNRVKNRQQRADDIIERYGAEKTTLVKHVKIELKVGVDQ